MAKQPATIELTVNPDGAEEWLTGGSAGVNVAESVERYADCIDTALRETWPDAEITVNVTRDDQQPARWVVYTDGSVAEDSDACMRTIEDLLTDVFNGQYGEFLVEA